MADELAPLHAQIDANYPENLKQIAEVLYGQLVRHAQVPDEGMPAARREELAFLALRLSDCLSDEFGGEALYIGKGLAYRASLRDREMYAQYQNGATVKALARKYSLTEVWVRKVCNALTAIERAERQGRLEL